MNNLFSVKDQVVVITGGTGVLGKAIAAHLAAEGAKVVILGRKAEVGNAIVENIKAKGGEAMFLVTNVLDEAVLKQNLEDILAKYGRVDALLNAAGGNMPGATIAPTGTFFDLKVDEFQKVLNLNLTGTVLPTQVFLKPMVEQKKGAIVNFSSDPGKPAIIFRVKRWISSASIWAKRALAFSLSSAEYSFSAPGRFKINKSKATNAARSNRKAFEPSGKV